jgi:hypothetical protein
MPHPIFDTEAAFFVAFVDGLVITPWGGREIALTNKRQRRVKPAITPAIVSLTQNEDSGGRSLEGHRAMVEWYADRYAKGRDPLTGNPLTDAVELTRYNREYTPPALAEGRGGTRTESEGLELLTAALRGTASLPDIDDD